MSLNEYIGLRAPAKTIRDRQLAVHLVLQQFVLVAAKQNILIVLA
jgi:hypothetical protein